MATLANRFHANLIVLACPLGETQPTFNISNAPDTAEPKMKTGSRFNATFPLALILILIAGLCLIPQGYARAAADNTTVAEINQQTRELLKSLKDYTVGQRDEAIQKTKAALDNLDNRINLLEADIVENWDNMDRAAREQSRVSMKALRDQRNQVAEWYGSMKSSSSGAWEQMKSGFSSAYSALHGAWQKAENEFSKSK
jgi:hypothetical protein